MIEAVASTLLVSAVGAIVFVAYRHPPAFTHLYKSAKPLLRFGTVGLLAWMTGDSQVRGMTRAALPKALPGNLDAQESTRAILADEPPYRWTLLGVVAVYVFLEALAALPKLGVVGAETATSLNPTAERDGEQARERPT